MVNLKTMFYAMVTNAMQWRDVDVHILIVCIKTDNVNGTDMKGKNWLKCRECIYVCCAGLDGYSIGVNFDRLSQRHIEYLEAHRKTFFIRCSAGQFHYKSQAYIFSPLYCHICCFFFYIGDVDWIEWVCVCVDVRENVFSEATIIANWVDRTEKLSDKKKTITETEKLKTNGLFYFGIWAPATDDSCPHCIKKPLNTTKSTWRKLIWKLENNIKHECNR